MTKINKAAALSILIAITITGGCRKVPNPPVPDKSIKFEACVQGSSATSLDIVTLNIENFPKEGYQTISAVADLINDMDADIIALQEISSESDFNELDDLLIAYTGIFYPFDNDDWNLAWLYKNSEIAVDNSQTKAIFRNDFYAFPRPPFEIHITHAATGISAVIINNHLKCCGGNDNEERRRSAAEQLYSYTMENYPDDPVIILGDLNDEITGTTEEDNVFWIFADNPSSFAFADISVALGSALWWSYPSWPSHIDHIIISDELFDRLDYTTVFKADACYSLYPDIISDHRPVFARLK
ncbi:MAG: endonuclease/exonuclease/phosphatase family protein [Bacteroidales bacterium]